MTLVIETLTGPELDAALDDVARLRIEVFRDFPYLYDGDPAYERHYLETYRDNPSAILVVARDGARIVGASTGTPLLQHDTAFFAPLSEAGYAPQDVFYCAESVLLAGYRGQGAGHAFFDAREAHARTLGARHSVFCAVERAPDHPARPEDYRALDPFWRRRGYAPIPGAVARFSWREVGQDVETEHRLPFWGRTL
ncbi:GNAT family N-acetyltransferase [Alphaproteobacteria bacterium GH1-50]|uniref:GNAT family N-acetyltransferase n=1 Tax=Kangsaoukella pontilimi TaxID=2691042 RepID=A0A7C9IGL1_9RHOB|nr:GNAT family N-acetyltransferase [Kangsaoukella pontilimi]MXQ08027.1 GNAT family N-acetyltransferase [Kangsaoukella pontilimi]